ncbi:MAG TPA: TRAP transporter small permease subunit [Vineibacter sp.]|nr:TRAP transporter small permease subunit [Vineibacter sp.]
MIAFLTQRLLPGLDAVSRALAMLAMVQIVVLVIVMLWEVVARYGFDSPTLWANDITYMTNGTLFLLGAAWTLRRNQHIRIDFLSARLPLRAQHGINLLFYLLLFLPLLWLIGDAALGKAWKAWRLGELEQMSAWEPRIWPFMAGIALGVVALGLQCVAETVRHAIGVARPDAVYAPGAHDHQATV